MTILSATSLLMCSQRPDLETDASPTFGRTLAWGSRTSWCRRMPPRRRRRAAGGASNLTAGSYHGYPWTEPSTPQQPRRKNPSIANLNMAGNADAPRASPDSRAPDSDHLSLRSFMSSMGAAKPEGYCDRERSRRGKAVLLRDGAEAGGPGDAERRRSNLGRF